MKFRVNSLVLTIVVVLAFAGVVQAWGRTGGDLGSRVAALEALIADQQSEIEALRAASYVVVGSDPFLTNERVLEVESIPFPTVFLFDGGPNDAVLILHDDLGFPN